MTSAARFFIIKGLFLITLVAATIWPVCGQSASPVPTRPPVSAAAATAPAAGSAPAILAAPTLSSASGPAEIEVGLYLLELAKLDMKECEYFADFYVWYKADPQTTASWTPENIEFSNGTIEFASPLVTSSSGDGRKYWSQRVKGKFRGKFNLQLYPFDTQILPIVIEDRESTYAKLQFVPDPNAIRDVGRWLDPKIQVPDWKIKGASLETDKHHYQTDFGLANGDVDGDESYYSRLTYSVRLERLFIPHMIKFMIPLLVIAGMAYLVFYINASEFESQCAICVTSLLSAVALHISQSDALPAVGYLVVADKIFILFYMVIFSALVQTVIANNYEKAGYPDTAAKVDYVFRFIYPFTLVAGCVFIMLTSGM